MNAQRNQQIQIIFVQTKTIQKHVEILKNVVMNIMN